MHVISQPDWRPQPWKNGGGVTHEIWRAPDVDDYDVRVSLAQIAMPGPFSLFPGYRRWSFLVGTAPVELTHEQKIQLVAIGDHIELPGEAQITAMLHAGPTHLLNVFVRTIPDSAEVPLVVGYGPVAHPVHFMFALGARRGSATHPQLARWDSVVYDQAVATDTADSIWIA